MSGVTERASRMLGYLAGYTSFRLCGARQKRVFTMLVSLPLALVVALAPPIALLILIWRIDKLEREPWSAILITVALGAASATLALVLELALDTPIQTIFNNSVAAWLIADNFVGVALVEEACKMLAVMIFVWRRAQFNCRFDGVVYGAAASLGFAAIENVKYTLSYGISTGIVRAFTAIPGHFIFGIFMGAFIGAAKCAKFDGKHGKKCVLLFFAILVPTLLHGYYDYLLSVPEYLPYDTTAIWILYLIAMIVAAIIVIIGSAKSDRYIDRSIVSTSNLNKEKQRRKAKKQKTQKAKAKASTNTPATATRTTYPPTYTDPNGQLYVLMTMPDTNKQMYVPVVNQTTSTNTTSATQDGVTLPTYTPDK